MVSISHLGYQVKVTLMDFWLIELSCTGALRAQGAPVRDELQPGEGEARDAQRLHRIQRARQDHLRARHAPLNSGFSQVTKPLMCVKIKP